jgi:hypothetical protein
MIITMCSDILSASSSEFRLNNSSLINDRWNNWKQSYGLRAHENRAKGTQGTSITCPPESINLRAAYTKEWSPLIWSWTNSSPRPLMVEAQGMTCSSLHHTVLKPVKHKLAMPT